MEILHKIHEGSNLGSFYKTEIAHITDFLNFNENEILFREERGWKEIEITDETGVFSFTDVELEDGSLSRLEGGFALHGPIVEISKKLRPYIGKKSVLRLTTLNNEVMIVGHPENPVILSSNANTGVRYSDRSEVGFTFSWDVPFK